MPRKRDKNGKVIKPALEPVVKKWLAEDIDERNPRFLTFKDHYLKGASIEVAAEAAGYDRACGEAMAKKIGTNIERELRIKGITEERLAAKLEALLDAKVVKWNPAAECFEAFEDGRLQLQALVEAAAYLGIEKKGTAGINVNGNLLVVSNVPRPQRTISAGSIDGEVVH